MSRKTLVIVYWNLGIGGIQKRIRDISQSISKENRDWHIILLLRREVDGSFLDQVKEHNNLSIEVYPFNNQKIRPVGGFFFWLLYKYIQIKPTTCLTFLPLLGIAMILIKKAVFWVNTKLVINEGVLLSEYLYTNKLTWLKPFISALYSSAENIIVPTLACKEDLELQFFFKKNTILVLSNWTLIRKAAKKGKTLYDLVYVGRFEKEKNVLVLCDVIKSLKSTIPTIKVIMVGSGSLLPYLQTKIKKLQLTKNIIIKEFTVKAFQYMTQSKALILPSLSEGMPNVVLEAAMLRTPSVVANFKGAHEVVIHAKTGYVADTTEQLYTYSKEILKYPQLRIEMGKKAQEFVESKFTQRAQKRFIRILLE